MDPSRVASLWRRFYPERFWVDAELVSFNCSDAVALVEADGFMVAKRGHLCAICAPDLEVCGRYVAWAQSSFPDCRKWSFGGDRRHFFPGVPVECVELASWLERLGFARGSSVFDLERDLSTYNPPVQPTRYARRCASSDRERLSDFLRSEFSARWHDDSMEKFDEDPSSLFVLEIEDAIEGFTMTQMDGDRQRRAGAVWSHSLGPGWAALGPIGISSRVRGRGYGDGLLAAALCSLRDQGAKRTIIDWTVLTGFYGKHGFEVTREYTAMRTRDS